MCKTSGASGIAFHGFHALVCAFFIALTCLSCSGKAGPQVGGESHWLAMCARDRDCGGEGLLCVCGSCTVTCSTDTGCGKTKPAACYNASSPLLLQRCEPHSLEGGRGLCLPSCARDADCANGRSCVVGACVPASTRDAGMSSSTLTGLAAIDAGEPAHVGDVSWSDPIEVPVPQEEIEGADDRLLGTWRSPSDCVAGCFDLVIARNDAGAITGHLVFSADPNGKSIVGPFPAAEDPEIGYPVGLSYGVYSDLTYAAAIRVPYRMLDGRLDHDRLTFAWSPFDVWHDWCGLQQPYSGMVSGRGFFACVPGDEIEQATLDSGRRALCLPPEFQCGDSSVQGSCLDVCHCDREKCDADVYKRRQELSATVQGETLVVRLSMTTFWSNYTLALQKVKP